MEIKNESILIMDFGGQYSQLIARRVRECNVYCELKPYKISADEIKKAGYRIIRVNTVIMHHLLGDLKLKKIGNRTVHVWGHSSFRKFYIAQNTVYFQRKHPDIYPKSVCFKKLVKFSIKTLLYEQDRLDKMKSIIRGIKSGKKMDISHDDWIS